MNLMSKPIMAAAPIIFYVLIVQYYLLGKLLNCMYLTICILFTFLYAFSKNRWIFACLFFKYPVKMVLI